MSLKIWDAYRPPEAQQKLWDIFPNEDYIANPAKNPPHCQGIAVDLTLVHSDGTEIPMPTDFDEFSERAHRTYKGITQDAVKNAQLLEDAMESEGFKGFPTEWWHFDYVLQ